MFEKLTNAIWSHISDNKAAYMVALSSIVIGITVGAGVLVSMSGEQYSSIQSYLSESLQGMRSVPVEPSQTFRIAFLNTVKLSLLIWALGFTILGVVGTPLVIGIRSFACGFTVAFLIRSCGGAGLLAAIIGILPQMIIVIPALLVFGAMSIRFSHSITFSKLEKREKWRMMFTYSVFSSIMLVVLLIGALIEGYISPSFLDIALSILI